MKKLQVTMGDGSVYELNAWIIAKNRAIHYANKESDYEKALEVYKAKFANSLDDPEELIDWAQNNMNWSDVKDSAKQIQESDDVDYEDGWANGEMEVVED